MSRCCVVAMLLISVSLAGMSSHAAAEVRSDQHDLFANELWTYLTSSAGYRRWQQSDDLLKFEVGPTTAQGDRFFLNSLAASATGAQPHGAIIVTEHGQAEGQESTAVTVWYKMNAGYHPKFQDWYFAHFAPDGTVLKTSADKALYSKRGFVTIEEDGRLWVFATGSAELLEFHNQGELAKQVIRPGAGPDGMTLKAPDTETIDAYLMVKDGYVTKMEDGRVWIFREGSEELKAFETGGELAEQVIRPGAGLGGVTLKAPDAETIDGYLGQP